MVRPEFPSAFPPATCASDLVQKGRFAQYLPCAQVACDHVAPTMEPQCIHHGAPAHSPSGPRARAITVSEGGSTPHRSRSRRRGRSDHVQQTPRRTRAPKGHDVTGGITRLTVTDFGESGRIGPSPTGLIPVEYGLGTTVLDRNSHRPHRACPGAMRLSTGETPAPPATLSLGRCLAGGVQGRY